MSQTLSVQLRLRDLIVSGEMPPGERLSEPSVAERLGASRTPVRAALARLAEEGLVEPIPSGGFAVRSFAEEEIQDAIELRGTLEGHAARLAAERGAPAAALAEMKRLIARMDEATSPPIREGNFTDYVALNAHFHELLVETAGSAVVARQIGRVVALPFASPSGFVLAQAALPEAHRVLTAAQEHHRGVVEAIEHREGARAEALMREHARLARRNLDFVMRNQESLRLVPGGALIRRRSWA
ncbi:GntR family transcriptional regulator [Falsiroseomonas stagni]|uniref:GntR family transcriptional regulator, vanillate catabolism transcriptional regulator n=1 Tax=Falsiroseomonas stagni DSM 19981 TaxID=1123062 RepID=A0A1I4FFJ8_9PROT|nr:GntR family transcriptional regulator [Falsiroseomonas stagni]SFL16708.1 GntR family transcriptional regulator, vanillate catabolism transcriptional regulator [Falsiroseomonas stagni DSM 19981]